MSHFYKPTFVHDFPVQEKHLSAQSQYWDEYKIPITLKESSAIKHLDLTKVYPYKLAITSSTKVQIYDLNNDKPIVAFTNFKKSAYGASFRKDGELLIAGCDDTGVKLLSLATKSQLREFKGHTR
ncbi:unnamed protein product [Gordionus sp. m RMFG-2023]